MWWDWWATFHQPFHLFDGNIFFPLKYSLAFSEHNYGIASSSSPRYALGIRPLTVQGVATLLGFAFSGYGAFPPRGADADGSTGAGLVAGIAFAFTPVPLSPSLPRQLPLFGMDSARLRGPDPLLRNRTPEARHLARRRFA